jgi:hypothetical protein
MVVRKGAYASTLIALALAVGVPAQARIAANGITTNKISSNRIAANTLSSNRIAANTVSSNRLAGQRLAGKSIAANAGDGAFSEVTAIELPDGKLVTR